MKCKLIGCLRTEDEKGEDDKFIFVPDESVDKNSVSINETSDIKSDIISKIKYFFEHYKDLDPDKWIKVKDFIDVTTSKELIKQGKKNITEKLYFTQAFK